MDKHSKLMELLHVTDASLGESVSAGTALTAIKLQKPATAAVATASGSAFAFPAPLTTYCQPWSGISIPQHLPWPPAGKVVSPEVSEETVNCGSKAAAAGVVLVDMLCEESVCSADDDTDARPDRKKKRRTEAPSVGNDDCTEEVQSPLMVRGASATDNAPGHGWRSTRSHTLAGGTPWLAPRPGTPRPQAVLPHRVAQTASPMPGGGSGAAFAAGFNVMATTGGMMHAGAYQLPLQGPSLRPPRLSLQTFTSDGSVQLLRSTPWTGCGDMPMLSPSSRQAASDGSLAVLPLLTPIGCDPNALAEEGSRGRWPVPFAGAGHTQRSHGNTGCEASEDERCDRALRAMKLLARGRTAMPPPPSFWAPNQQRACDGDGDEDLIFHMEPLPDDLEPEE